MMSNNPEVSLTVTQLRTAALECLDAYVPDGEKDKTLPLLKALIEHAPNDRGRRAVCIDVLESQDRATGKINSLILRGIAERYRTGLIIPMKALGGKTPAVSSHPSKHSPELKASEIAQIIEVAKRDSGALRKLVLFRDNYRSVMSGAIDIRSYEDKLVECENPDAEEFGYTEAAHILPFSLSLSSEKPSEIDYKSQVWEVISRFSGIEISELPVQDGMINRHENVLMLTQSEHKHFGELKCWFVPVEGGPGTHT